MRLPNSSFVSPVLIGRGPVLQRLAQLIDSACHGRGQIALITGEAGIGKSRMVTEAKTLFAAAGAGLVIQGRCFEPDYALPYAPLLDLLRQYLSGRGGAEIVRELGPSAPELIKLLPELSMHLPGIATSVLLEPEVEKRRLFDALAQCFARMCGEGAAQPLLLVIEDLHWSDETSLEFLAYFAHRVALLPLLLLLTFRSDEVQPALHHFVARLDRARLGTELSLERLSAADVDALIQSILTLGRPVYKEFLEPVFALTDGNPFFVEEILKSLTAGGDIFLAEGRWERKSISELRIPRSVQDAVQRCAAQLSEPARQVLTLAAVAGRRFDFALLLQLTGWSERDLLAIVKEMLAAQLVVEESDDQFAFRHALTRQAVYAALLARERRALHRQVAEAMQHVYAGSLDAHLGDFAHHFYEAGAWQQALAWSQRAGEKAQALYTPAAAIEHFTRALEAIGKLNAPAPHALYRARGQAHELVGQFDAARADFEQALQSARAQRDAHAEWQALIDLGALWAARDYARTGDYLQQALAVARPLGDPAMLGHTLNRVGNWYTNAEQSAEALRQHREALDIFEQSGDRRGLAETLDLLGTASILGGNRVAAIPYCRKAAEIFREMNDRPSLILCSAMLAAGAPQMDSTVVTDSTSLSLPEALHIVDSAVHMARDIGFRAGEAFGLWMQSTFRWAGGDFIGALESTRGALATARLIGHEQWSCAALVGVGAILLDVLAPRTALRSLAQALKLAKSLGSLYFTYAATAEIASARVATGEFILAREVLDSAPMLPSSFDSVRQRDCWYARAQLAIAEHDYGPALEIGEKLVATASNMHEGVVIPSVWVLRARALVGLGRAREALPLLDAALANTQVDGLRPWLWRIHAALGDANRALKRRQEAEEQYAFARACISELALNIPDAPLDLEPGLSLRANFIKNANAMLPSRRPLSPSRSAKREFGGLTGRERQVAALISRGRSNQQIAAELVLSERTVEGHVGNILSKLGFASRAQIAVWAVEHGLSGNHPK